MITNFRLNKKEQKLLEEAYWRINTEFMSNKKEPLKASEILHEVIELALQNASGNKSGKVKI